MNLRPSLARAALLTALALLLSWAASLTPPPAAARGATARYIVTLTAPPLPAGADAATLRVADAAQGRALAAVSTITGAPAAPLYVYRHALNGFAVELTPAEAAQVGALPGVARVAREQLRSLQTDRGPSFIGAAQGDLRPTFFAGELAGAAGAGGRAITSYALAARRLEIQLFYSGLGGAPTLAELRQGGPGDAGNFVASLAGLAIGAPGADGGYEGVVTLDLTAEAALFAGQLFVRLEGPAGVLRAQLAASRGEGVVVAVLDGGINVDHPSFQDPAPDGYDHRNPLGAGNYLGVCNPSDGDGRYDPSFTCNDKLIGAYTYDTTADFPDPQGAASPRDDDGHGSHTAGTVAGNVLSGGPGVPVAGVAPHANLIIHDVCGTIISSSACSSLALVAAIDQAIADRVDIISYSIGSSSTDPWTDEEALGFLSALDAGIFVSVSAGNDGPGAGTVGSPANAPWVLGVAASTHDRRFVNTLGGFSGGSAGLRPVLLTGTGVAAGLGVATPLIDAAALSPANGNCGGFSTAQAAQVAGKIVVCDDFSGEGLAAPNLWAAGAAGAVFISSSLFGDELFPGVFTRPSVQLTAVEGADLRSWLSGCADCAATIGGVTRAFDAVADDVADFSSRGPDTSVPDVLKPDLAAPGVAILAASADFEAGEDDFMVLSGTSMAAPHASGIAALVRQLRPDWTPAEIKSAMMLTANGALTTEGGAATAGPFDRGAGRVRAQAAYAGFVLDQGAAGFAAADPAVGGDPTRLNLASIAASECLITCTFTRTLRSTLGVTLTWAIGGSDGAGFTLSTEPADAITLGPGERKTIVVTATTTAEAREIYGFGSLVFTPQTPIAPTASMPVAIRAVRTSLGAPLEFRSARAAGGAVVPVRAQAFSGLTTGTYGLVRMTVEQRQLAEDPTPGNPDDIARGGIYVRQVTLPAGTTRLRVQTRASTAPDLDLYLYADLDGDGGDEIYCQSAGLTNEELCDVQADDLVSGLPAPLSVTIAVQNYTGSGALLDSFELLYGVVGQASAGNLTASGPATVPAGQPFDLTLSWSLAAPRRGDIYIGVVTLGRAPGAAPAAAGDLGGVAVTVRYEPYKVSLPDVRR